MSKEFPLVNVLNVPFINTTQAAFLTTVESRINARLNTFIVTANPEIVMYARENPDYQRILSNADYITPDGIGILKGAAILGTPMPERITGYDTMLALLKWGNEQQKSVYLVGAKPEVITDVATVVADRYPHLNVVGTNDGYFADFAPIAQDIAKTKPDMVFLAVGFPKQEQLIADYRHQNNGLWMGVGGSFDVLSGHTKRAPKFFQQHHLEWFYRLITEPTRFKRMMVLPRYLNTVKKAARHQK
ncbi:WecB/TagA/CpsF family glycosyltransferase [Lactobacillus sp. LC28-10]|uniref:N-acetylglucosaminyldiphosphoundecaprenol N-acetyl-beta-D-mannosaminyltransferase n=1 Tax=Secundilactobacillus angelensis TaxID=2722706 RepID=A0ABX1KX98_9LACO|nr:WecB/TagA/CpsF family glycosyltransferase [Secundilactobacillus angelensis]MCH5462266.1 WecB/TagA/CpsF family glycosyltransferase [Secundilactobacillus angelensis]NLR18557.1 WecB/TagA/CpsF family glycosyltransferase [Secundilactobacillus angelensis]